jgi:pescadillo protein
MPKGKFASRNASRKQGSGKRKLYGKLSGTRLLKKQGKRLKPGVHGTVSEYVGRTKAVKRLQVSLRDFRRLCILKGVYPRDPKNKKYLDPGQTYYHFKDIAFLSHEPLLARFNEQLVRPAPFRPALG